MTCWKVRREASTPEVTGWGRLGREGQVQPVCQVLNTTINGLNQTLTSSWVNILKCF